MIYELNYYGDYLASFEYREDAVIVSQYLNRKGAPTYITEQKPRQEEAIFKAGCREALVHLLNYVCGVIL